MRCIDMDIAGIGLGSLYPCGGIERYEAASDRVLKHSVEHLDMVLNRLL